MVGNPPDVIIEEVHRESQSKLSIKRNDTRESKEIEAVRASITKDAKPMDNNQAEKDAQEGSDAPNPLDSNQKMIPADDKLFVSDETKAKIDEPNTFKEAVKKSASPGKVKSFETPNMEANKPTAPKEQ